MTEYPPTPLEVRNPLFEERINKYKIPPWPGQAKFETVIAFQIDTIESETFSGSTLIRPEQTKARQRNTSPRAVVVSAGFRALDYLYSNDILIGDIVWFAKHANYAFEVEIGSGKHTLFCFLHASEIKLSEDSSGRIRRGEVELGTDHEGCWGVTGRPRSHADDSNNPDAMR